MSRRRAPSRYLLAFLALVPAVAQAQVGMERPVFLGTTGAFAQISPAPGVEFLGADPGLTLGYGVYSASTGNRLAGLLAPLDDRAATRILEDFDGDGFDDVLGLLTEPLLTGTTLSLQRFSKGLMQYSFPNFHLPDLDVVYQGTMNLNASNPNAMVFSGRSGVYIVRQNGILQYNSQADPSFPAVANGTLTTFIADFDGDGFDEVCVTFQPSSPGDTWSALLGDTTPSLGVGDGSLATRPLLMPGRPNPTTGSARIAFQLPKPAEVQLQVYDAAGRLVSRLASGRMEAGLHEQSWTGRDAAGRRVPGGVYFYELVVDGVKETRKLVQLN